MTKIILVIIGILLAAAAAIMTVYYGGDAFTGSYAEAEAGTLLNQGVQINSAFELYYAERGTYPGNPDGTGALEELVATDFLSSIPVPPGERISGIDWNVDYDRGIARSIIGSPDDAAAAEVCQKAREKAGLTDPVKSCDDPTIRRLDPCCIMNSADL